MARIKITILFLGLFALGCGRKEGPEIIEVFPEDGAVDVVLNTSIKIAFSCQMDTLSVQQAFSTEPSTQGSFLWQNDSVMTYIPKENLSSNTLYTVTITKEAQDKEGNGLEDDYTFSFTTGTRVSTQNFYMLGRSVMEGWFVHWGWDWDDNHPVIHGRFTLYHRYILAPWDGIDNMIDSIRTIVKNIPDTLDPVVFFKLCFADFEGGDQYGAEANLERNKGIVDSVYNIVIKEYGYRLIIGNALPVPSSWIDEYIVWNQKEYNKWLLGLEEDNPGKVFIFDFYSILANSDGAIKDEYTDGEPNDAHPNEEGYKALDTPFFNFLEENF